MTSVRLPQHDDLHATYISKANALVEAGRDELTTELADAFAAESSSTATAHGTRRSAGRGTPGRSGSDRRPGRTSRLSGLTRSTLQRFDRYTLDVFNAGSTYRSRDDRSA